MFTEVEFKKIQAAVAEGESKTSGQIVVHFTDRSGGYRWIPWCAALLGALAAGLVGWVGSALGTWFWSPLALLQVQGAVAAVVFYVAGRKAVHQRLVPRQTMRHRVHREALARFVISGVGGTKHRTGILVFLSEFERSVELIADSAIHEVCGHDYWSVQTQAIAAGIQAGKSVDAVCDAVREIGQRLSETFPHTEGEENELPDGPSEGKFSDNSDT